MKGVAFGGDRGISRVELSVDDGQSWTDAKIDYAGGDLAWSSGALATDGDPRDLETTRLWCVLPMVRATSRNGIWTVRSSQV